jgi:hypothetical protein
VAVVPWISLRLVPSPKRPVRGSVIQPTKLLSKLALILSSVCNERTNRTDYRNPRNWIDASSLVVFFFLRLHDFDASMNGDSNSNLDGINLVSSRSSSPWI